MTTLTHAAEVMHSEAAALADDKLTRAAEDFLAADAALQEACADLTRAQISGPDPVPPQVEYLHDEAQYRWDLLASGWAEHLIPARAREAGTEYVRPKVRHVVVEQSGPCDWSRGRAA